MVTQGTVNFCAHVTVWAKNTTAKKKMVFSVGGDIGEGAQPGQNVWGGVLAFFGREKGRQKKREMN